jgi:hypothetical protein
MPVKPHTKSLSMKCAMVSLFAFGNTEPSVITLQVNSKNLESDSFRDHGCSALTPELSPTRHLPATVQLRNADDSSGTQQPSRIDIEQNVALKRSWAFSKQQRTQLPFQLSPFRQASRKCIPLFVPGRIFTERFCAAIIAKRGREISAVCSRCD